MHRSHAAACPIAPRPHDHASDAFQVPGLIRRRACAQACPLEIGVRHPTEGAIGGARTTPSPQERHER
jgi:hypothetical protein